MFRLPWRQTEGPISSINPLLWLGLAAPDHRIRIRRAETLNRRLALARISYTSWWTARSWGYVARASRC
ncbi:hypothetical protein ACFQX4_00045 [Roseomonas sp. GCM10028921]